MKKVIGISMMMMVAAVISVFIFVSYAGIQKKVTTPTGLKNGPFTLARNYYYGDGYILDWLICGPFPNPGGRTSFFEKDHLATEKDWNKDYLKSAGGEDKIEPFENMVIEVNGEISRKWKPYHSPGPIIDFLKIFSKRDYILAYAASYIKSDKAKDIFIKMGSDDGYKLWLNHKLISELHTHRSAVPNQDTIKAHLKKGYNLLLIKVDTDLGHFLFLMRLTNIAGGPLKGVAVYTQRPE